MRLFGVISMLIEDVIKSYKNKKERTVGRVLGRPDVVENYFKVKDERMPDILKERSTRPGRVIGRPDLVKEYYEKQEICFKDQITKEQKTYDNWPVYILIRTSNRPEYFKVLMESIKAQTYPHIITIVHTDDPRDTYVEGDIIIKGSCFPPKVGTGPYNLYNNRLLEAIPEGPSWYHYIDDDDVYTGPDVIERLVKCSGRNYCNVTRVIRWEGTVWPKKWRTQRSFQTECFFLHTDHKKRSNWWANKGGDHYYSRKITNQLDINWIEGVPIVKAQEGKSHGRRIDLGQIETDKNRTFKPDDFVNILVFNHDKRTGKYKKMEFSQALKLERAGKGVITYEGVTIDDRRIEKDVKTSDDMLCVKGVKRLRGKRDTESADSGSGNDGEEDGCETAGVQIQQDGILGEKQELREEQESETMTDIILKRTR
jgi:glycosyltransferase involved in cell wall biosynthesis